MLAVVVRGRSVRSLLSLVALVVFAAASSVGTAAQSDAAKPVKVSAAESDKLIMQEDREGDRLAKASHVNGKATFEFTVTPEGKVTDITLISETKNSHGASMMGSRVLGRRKYHPYLVDGKPTAMRTTTTIEYHY